MRKKKKIFTFCDFYILLRLIYELQFLLFGRSGTLFSRIVFLFIVGASIYYTVYAISRYKLPKFMRALSVLLLMFTIYGVIPIITGESYRIGLFVVPSYGYLQQIYLSLLPIFPFFVFTKKGIITQIRLQRWLFIFFVAVSLQYIQNQNLSLIMAMERGSNAEEFANNVGYYFLGIVPLLSFLSKKKTIQYIGLAYAMTFIILSVKRGAILIGAICLVWFLMNTLKNARHTQKIVVFVLGVVIVVFGFFMIQNMLDNSLYFNSRLEATLEGDSSARDVYYARFWEHFFNEENVFSLLVGNGANATIRIGGNYAHNDWLEIAINQGVLGLIIYLVYFICFFKSCRISRFDGEVYLAISSLFIIELLKTMFSMSYSDLSIYSTFSLGYCMARISDYKSQMDYRMVKN